MVTTNGLAARGFYIGLAIGQTWLSLTVAKGDDFRESDRVGAVVAVFCKGNWRGNGSGSTLVRASVASEDT